MKQPLRRFLRWFLGTPPLSEQSVDWNDITPAVAQALAERQAARLARLEAFKRRVREARMLGKGPRHA